MITLPFYEENIWKLFTYEESMGTMYPVICHIYSEITFPFFLTIKRYLFRPNFSRFFGNDRVRTINNNLNVEMPISDY